VAFKDEADMLSGDPILLSKVITKDFGNPYGGASATGLTNLLNEVHASNTSSSL